MILTAVIAVLFLAIVFFHYLQGFFSATISAILAVLSAALAFSLHEWIVESFLQGKAANTAHGMVLVALFALFYLAFRIIFDKAIPEGVSLPAAIDRVGGAVMGSVAAIFALGILTIAAQELPFGAAVAGYTKYDTKDAAATILTSVNGQQHQGTSNSELVSEKPGDFGDRKQLFPIILPGVDDIVVDTVAHLSGDGSLAGSQPLTDVHPDFLQEMYGQRAGIQAGTKHVQMSLPNDSDAPVKVNGVFLLPDPEVAVLDAAPLTLQRGVAQNIVKQLSFVQKESKPLQTGTDSAGRPINRTLLYVVPPPHKTLVIVRLEFGQRAKDDEDANIRFSPGAVRLVAPKKTDSGVELGDYYPIGTLEKGWEHPSLYVDKADDFLFVRYVPAAQNKPGVDLVYLLDDDALKKDHGKLAAGTFLEFKRLVREELGNKDLTSWTAPEVKEGEHFGTVHPAGVELKPPGSDKPAQ